MLFDLTGKRKRVVQVVYATLALLMGGSLVLFGIGSDAPGGILDAVGLGSNSNGDADEQYEQQINRAEERLQSDPNNPQALLNLTRYHYLNANAQITQDPQSGAIDVPPAAQTELEEAVDAWRRYLRTKPANPDPTVAANAGQAYVLLNDPDGAAEAQRIVAEEQNSAAAYGNLAFYLYADFQFKAGDEAATRAVELADSSERQQIERNLARLEEQFRERQKQIDEAAEQGGGAEAGEQQLTDPFGALGGSGGGLTTPAP